MCALCLAEKSSPSLYLTPHLLLPPCQPNLGALWERKETTVTWCFLGVPVALNMVSDTTLESNKQYDTQFMGHLWNSTIASQETWPPLAMVTPRIGQGVISRLLRKSETSHLYAGKLCTCLDVYNITAGTYLSKIRCSG